MSNHARWAIRVTSPRAARLQRLRAFQALLAAACLLSLAPPPALAEVWGVKTLSPVSGPPSTLFRMEAGFFSVGLEITLAGAPIDADGLAMFPGQPLRGFRILVTPPSSQLITIDPATGTATAVGPLLEGRDIRGAAFTSSGRLLVLDALADQLLEIDEATGQPMGSAIGLTVLGSRFDLSTITDIVEVEGGQLIVTSTNRFFSLDPATGVLTDLFTDAVTGPDGILVAHTGLSWGPDMGGGVRLGTFDVNGEDDIFAYSPEAGFARSLIQQNILFAYNAGRGDMASLPAALVGVESGGGSHLGRVHLAAKPNPSRRGSGVVLTLPSRTEVEVTVHDVTGRRLRRLAAGVVLAGRHELGWDGRDEQGREVAPGLYFYRAEAGAEKATAKVVLVH